MNHKGETLSAMLVILALFFGFTTMVCAQQSVGGPGGAMMTGGGGMPNNGGTQMGGGQNRARFSAHGTVVSIDAADPKALAMMVTVDRASVLLRDQIGKPLSFPVRRNVRVGMMGTGYAGFNIDFSEIQPDDVVKLMGYFDNTTSEYVITQIKVRGY